MQLHVHLAEDLGTLLELWRQRTRVRRLRRPEARGEHMDRELDAVDARALVLPRGAEALHRVGAHLHVGEHALELGGELVAALRFELGDHRALAVVRDGAPAEEAFGEVLLVILLEDVLLLKVSEEHHHLVEDGVHLLLRSALHPLAHLLVDKERNVLWRSLVQVDKLLEGFVERVIALLVARERALDDGVVLVPQRQQPLHVDARLAAALLVSYYLLSPCHDVRGHDLADDGESVDGCLDAPEELVRAREVVRLVVLKHRDDPRVRHLGDGAHVHSDQLALDDLAQLGLGLPAPRLHKQRRLLRQKHASVSWVRQHAHFWQEDAVPPLVPDAELRQLPVPAERVFVVWLRHVHPVLGLLPRW